MRRRSVVGQSLVLIPLTIVALAALGYGWSQAARLWGTRKGLRVAQDQHQVARTIGLRLQSLLPLSQPTATARFPACGGAGGLAGELVSFRNLGAPAVPVSKEFRPTGVVGQSVPAWVPCVFPSYAVELYPLLDRVFVEIRRVGTPDLQELSVSLAVRVEVSSRAGAPQAIPSPLPSPAPPPPPDVSLRGGGSAQFTGLFRLRVASLADYPLVLLPTAPATPAVRIQDNSMFWVEGPAFIGAPNPAADLVEVNLKLPSPTDEGLVFAEQVDFQAERGRFLAPPPGMPMATTISRQFSGGVNFGVFADSPVLPYADGVLESLDPQAPLGAPAAVCRRVAADAVWQTRLDFSNLYALPSGVNVRPALPDLVSASVPNASEYPLLGSPPGPCQWNSSPLMQASLRGNPLVSYSEAKSSFTQSPATFPRIPDGGGVDKGISTLSETCGTGGPFVYMRRAENLAIQFGAADRNFCGLVIARRVLITVPAGVSTLIVGQIYAEEITVQGGGRVHLLLPTSTRVPDGFSGTFDMGDAANRFRASGAAPSHNFFVPIFGSRGPPALPATSVVFDPSILFRPHGAIAPVDCFDAGTQRFAGYVCTTGISASPYLALTQVAATAPRIPQDAQNAFFGAAFEDGRLQFTAVQIQ